MSLIEESDFKEFISHATKDELADELSRIVSLFNLNEVLTTSFDIKEVFDIVLTKAKELSSATDASIFLINKEEKVLEFVATTDAHIEDLNKIKVPMGKGISGTVAETGELINLANVQNDPRFFNKVDQSTGVTTESYLCVPLKVRNEIIGTAQFLNKAGGNNFTKADERLISAFSSQAALAIQTALLFKESLEKKSIERDIALAKEIQERYLPETAPDIQNYSIFGRMTAAKMVGGDYFNFFKHVHVTGEESADFVLADVSGKGVPAAIIVSTIHAALELLSPIYHDLSELAYHLNNYLVRNLLLGKFVTLFYARLYPNSGKVLYVNCGHNSPYIFNLNDNPVKARMLQPSGPILGLSKNHTFQAHVTSLNPWDVMLIFSDGVSEAQNETEEQFEENRMIKAAVTGARQAYEDWQKDSTVNMAQVIENAIRTQVDQFRGNAVVNDDTTMQVLLRLNE